jgi:ferredoxin
LGCGVCRRFCPTEASGMEARAEKVFVPQNTFEKVALQSIDQGKIGNFIFDDQTNIFHIFLREVINQFVKLPQVRRFLLKEEIYRRILNYFSKQDRFKQNIQTTCTK